MNHTLFPLILKIDLKIQKCYGANCFLYQNFIFENINWILSLKFDLKNENWADLSLRHFSIEHQNAGFYAKFSSILDTQKTWIYIAYL